ncbi:predicted protein [Scheffersomyces stipitis CBS 6054]|uniref:Uncharacterized protein n=1 Tax=Scheffersomyces stipitis (strain ATCC 58785 / CBS 6054 / NBRC 10063 / NRRL Y-11545) TaxID=322104 RepID=A3LXU5_PICST|nr:predicted protein [Scheffersomyces stipitis CBS 6054]ABN67862.1 predicted protein [Scheffersomyces stipitis CBS 6054]KAG2732143.1 hypothetical protein G9P44_004560 [Scheffersomyces stipitis]
MSQEYARVPTEEPPSYDTPRVAGDNIPDDFKYSVDVASCELPIRQLFIRKVYSLLAIQILGTVLVGFIIRSSPSIKEWCFSNMWLFAITMIGSIGFLVATHFKARSYPTNLFLLGGFTLCEAYLIGLCCAFVESDILIQALLLTFFIFIGLTLFAFQTKYDFTSWQGIVGMGLWALIGWGLVMIFFPGHSKTIELIYSGLGALIFSVYIIIDTQQIMKTAHLDDEIVSTIQLYLDVVNLFLFILRILNNRND